MVSGCADAATPGDEGAPPASVATSAIAPVSDDQREALVAKAEELAYYDGEPSPTTAEAVVTTAEKVRATGLVTVSGDSKAELLLVQLTGEFTGFLAKVPDGEDAPEGSVLWFVLDGKTLELRAWGIELKGIDLPLAGEPFTLPLETPIEEASIGEEPV